jgi:hypothetical protein
MSQWLTTVSSTFLPSLLVGICTAVITVRLSLRRFHAERWWERKADAYSRIVEALHTAAHYWVAQLNEDESGQEMSKEREKQLSEDYDRAASELAKATGVGAYIISEEVADALQNLQKRRRHDPRECAWTEIYDEEYTAHKEALTEIRKLAKKDLGVR